MGPIFVIFAIYLVLFLLNGSLQSTRNEENGFNLV